MPRTATRARPVMRETRGAGCDDDVRSQQAAHGDGDACPAPPGRGLLTSSTARRSDSSCVTTSSTAVPSSPVRVGADADLGRLARSSPRRVLSSRSCWSVSSRVARIRSRRVELRLQRRSGRIVGRTRRAAPAATGDRAVERYVELVAALGDQPALLDAALHLTGDRLHVASAAGRPGVAATISV